MASTNLFEAIFDKVDTALDTYIVSTVGNMIAFINPIFSSLLIIWIAIWGYLMLFGKVSEPLQEGVFRILRIGFIMALGLTAGTYMGVVVDVLAHGPEEIASIITGSPTGTSAATLDNLFSKVFEVSEAAWDMGGILDGNFGMYLISLIVLVVGAGLALVVAFLILLSKIMTTVLLGIHSKYWDMAARQLQVDRDVLKYIKPKEIAAVKLERQGVGGSKFINTSLNHS